jgi:hypothetical protein
MKPAWVQDSGVAENVGSPGTYSDPSAEGGWSSHTCSARKSDSSSAERAIVSRRSWAVAPTTAPGTSSYSPRSPVSSGQPRPIVSRDPGSTGSHWVPSGRSPYPSKLARCQNRPLAVS